MQEYWEIGGARAVVWWVVSAREALDAWEGFVARNVALGLYQDARLPGPLTWETQRRHHFALLSVRHVLRAVRLLDPPLVVSEELEAEIVAGRDLLEHWDQNLPIFIVRPRREEPGYKSGKGFAERHPERTPYFGIGWDSRSGPMLLPTVSAPQVHSLLDDALARALATEPELASFLGERPPSPWIDDPDAHGWRPRTE